VADRKSIALTLRLLADRATHGGQEPLLGVDGVKVAHVAQRECSAGTAQFILGDQAARNPIGRRRQHRLSSVRRLVFARWFAMHGLFANRSEYGGQHRCQARVQLRRLPRNQGRRGPACGQGVADGPLLGFVLLMREQPQSPVRMASSSEVRPAAQPVQPADRRGREIALPRQALDVPQHGRALAIAGAAEEEHTEPAVMLGHLGVADIVA